MLEISSDVFSMSSSFQGFSTSENQSESNFNEITLSIFENVFAFFGTLNKNGAVIMLKGNIFDKTVLNPELLNGQRFSETVFWQSSEYTPKILERAIEECANGKNSKVLLDFRLSSDEKITVELHLKFIESADHIFFCAYDVTEQEKQIEYHKQRSEQLLYAAESAEIGLWSWDLSDNTVYSTPKCNELFEINSYEMISYDSFVEILHPDDRSKVEGILQNSLQNGTEYDEHFRVIYSDARIEWIAASGKTFLDDTGKTRRMMGIVRKITDRKNAESDLSEIYDREKRAREEAVEANRAKDFFLAFVSHELRSPLNAILGWSKILLSKKVDEETHKNALETIERSARSQEKLINDLVDSARITSGKLRLEIVPLNLSELLKSIYLSQKPIAEAKNISLECNISQDEILVKGDAGRLQQVFNNLITNALKFTPENGKISILSETSDDFAKIIIKDSGQGISQEILPNIFRQFSQGDESISQNKSGLGLGLSIVKILVEKHGGIVQAHSEGKNQGSEFSVLLPLTEMKSEVLTPEKETKFSDDDKALNGISVLIVEDDNDSREVLGLFLEQCGATIRSANSAKEAMSILLESENNLPNVIVSDLAMPDEDGYSLIKRIRQLPGENGGNIPALALSAFATKENKQKAYESGFQKYDTKPFEPDLIIQDILELAKS